MLFLHSWFVECQTAFNMLKESLISSPVLAYPDFIEDFVLETDVCICGVEAVLSQMKKDEKLHPVSYTSGHYQLQSGTTASLNFGNCDCCLSYHTLPGISVWPSCHHLH